MEKVDIVIGVVGIVALVATGLGVAFYDDINGIEEWHIRTYETDLESQSQTGVGDMEEVDFLWDTPRNATGAVLDVTVTVQPGTPLDSGSVTVTLRLQGPGDVDLVSAVDSFDIADGSATFSITGMDWTETPEDFEGNDADKEDRIRDWDEPFTLAVIVDGPDALTPLPGFPAATFDVEVSGTATVYEAVPDIPDIEVI